MPSLLLADKLLGKTHYKAPDARWADETELGRELLDTVAAAKAQGLDAERALRSALRDLQEQIRESEKN